MQHCEVIQYPEVCSTIPVPSEKLRNEDGVGDKGESRNKNRFFSKWGAEGPIYESKIMVERGPVKCDSILVWRESDKNTPHCIEK